MVATNEAELERRGMLKRPNLRVVEELPLNALDRDVIGRAIRIEIPFTDLYKLRRIAELLAGLAEDIAFQSRRTDHPPLDSKDYRAWRRSTLFFLKHRSLHINREIRDLHGKHNKNGTTR